LVCYDKLRRGGAISSFKGGGGTSVKSQEYEGAAMGAEQETRRVLGKCPSSQEPMKCRENQRSVHLKTIQKRADLRKKNCRTKRAKYNRIGETRKKKKKYRLKRRSRNLNERRCKERGREDHVSSQEHKGKGGLQTFLVLCEKERGEEAHSQEKKKGGVKTQKKKVLLREEWLRDQKQWDSSQEKGRKW